MSGKCCALVLLLLVSAPTAASADWLISPAASYPFGGDTLGRKHAAWSLGLGWVDVEGFGLEADLSFAPEFFDGRKEDFTGSGSVLSAMGNVLLTGSIDGVVLPYATGGAGYMQMRVTSDAGTFRTTTREAGFNVGAGVIGFLGETIGVRGDLRYIRSFQNQRPSWTRGVDVDIAPGAFDFWRAGVAVTLRFRE